MAKKTGRQTIEFESGVGILTGGISATAGGVTAAILFGYIFSIISNPRIK